MIPDLISLFDSLTPPSEGSKKENLFSARPIRGYQHHRLGKDIAGNPALLISVSGQGTNRQLSPVILENLSVHYNVECRVSNQATGIEERCFTVLSCKDSDRVLRMYFLRVASALVAMLGNLPSESDISTVIGKLVELFRALAQPPKKSIQGLWGELLVIANSSDAKLMTKSWHPNPEDRYDFSFGDQRIEVKSVAGRVREHHFSLEQLSPPQGTTVLIASVLVERVGVGTSIMDLTDVIRPKLKGNTDLLVRLDQMIGLILGVNWRTASDDQFDLELAQQSLAYYELPAIPCIRREIPPGVTDVHFKSDLSGKPTAELQKVQDAGGIFAAAVQK